MKQFLITLIATLLSTTFFMPSLFGGSIKKKSTKRRLVIIDEGTNDSLQKGDKVCFYNNSDKKVACGRVVKARATSSYVRLGKKSIRRVRKGYEARVSGKEMVSSMPANNMGTGSSSSKWSIGAGYIIGLMPQTKFNPPSRAVDNTWVASEPGLMDKASLVGFGGEVKYHLSPSMAIAVGGRFKSLNLLKSQSDYNNASDPYILSEIKGSQFGGWADYYFYKLNLFSGLVANFGVGADLEMTSLDFQSIVFSDQDSLTEEEAANANLITGNASNMVISVRFPVSINYMLSDKLSLGAKFTLMFSALEMGRTFEVTAGAESGNEAAVENYEEAFDLGTAGLAFEITPIQVNYAF